MKIAVAVVVAFASLAASGDSKPSGGLMFNAFADHFVRYFCISRFPMNLMSSLVQRASPKTAAGLGHITHAVATT